MSENIYKDSAINNKVESVFFLNKFTQSIQHPISRQCFFFEMLISLIMKACENKCSAKHPHVFLENSC